MKTKFSHVNLISRNWKALAEFYIEVFDCRPKPPDRDLSGEWLDRLTNLEDARIRGIHLLLPGYDSEGPTLEIFEYERRVSNIQKGINREGFGHIAFVVEDVQKRLDLLLAHGGSTVGDFINTEIEGLGNLSIVYAKDPEGNIIEIQKWG